MGLRHPSLELGLSLKCANRLGFLSGEDKEWILRCVAAEFFLAG
jgi:hypothetical protein